MQRIRTFRWMSAGVGALCAAGWSCADVIHVPEDAPTIQAAIAMAVDGDEVVVAEGTYAEVIKFQGKAIEVRSAAGPATTILDAAALPESIVHIDQGEGPDSVLRGFSIVGTQFGFEAMVRIEWAAPTIVDCVLSGHAVDFAYESSAMVLVNGSPTVERCTFVGNGSMNAMVGAVSSVGGHPRFLDCRFEGNIAFEAPGVFVYGEAGEATFERCWFEGNTGLGSLSCYMDGLRVAECVFVDNIGAAVHQQAIGGETIFTNCSFVGNHGASGCFYNRQGTGTLVNCLFSGNEGPTFYGMSPPVSVVDVSYSLIPGGYPGIGNISGDPLLSDPSGGDIHLSQFSPCIGAGTNSPRGGLSSIDIDGEPRLQFCRVDIGADESPFPSPAAKDCNANGVDDECEIGDNPALDANGNGWLDQCEVGGDLFGSATWPNGRVYLVGGDLVVYGDLTIEANVQVRLGAGVGIEVRGSLSVDGESSDPVLLTCELSTERWSGIEFTPAASGALKWITIERVAGTAVLGDGAALALTDCTIRDVLGLAPGGDGIGVLLRGGGVPSLERVWVESIKGADGGAGATGAAGPPGADGAAGGTLDADGEGGDDGDDASAGGPGEFGGNAIGISVETGTAALIRSCAFGDFIGGVGGTGGTGGLGGEGGRGGNGTSYGLGAPGNGGGGGDGGKGGDGGLGGKGGDAVGLSIESASMPAVEQVLVARLAAGQGGPGGFGGKGGAGGKGGSGADWNVPFVSAGDGGDGGDGGLGGASGSGGDSGRAVGVRYTFTTSLGAWNLAQCTVVEMQAGVAGLAGQGQALGGAAGAGGAAGINDTGPWDGSTGSAGTPGSSGGSGGAGSVDVVYGIQAGGPGVSQLNVVNAIVSLGEPIDSIGLVAIGGATIATQYSCVADAALAWSGLVDVGAGMLVLPTAGFADPTSGDYRLTAASACVDAGSNALVPSGLVIDLSGEARIVDGDANGSAVVDMGGYEFQPAITLPGDLDGDGVVGPADLAILLGAWGGIGGPADLDGDGMVGAADLAMLLGYWS